MLVAYVVSNDSGKILGIYRTENECDENHEDGLLIQEFKHKTMTFEELVSLAKNGLQ